MNLTNTALNLTDHYLDWDVTADSTGSFSSWWDVTEDELNTSLVLTALGQSSGYKEQVFFTDKATPKIRFNTLGVTSGVSLDVLYGFDNPPTTVLPLNAPQSSTIQFSDTDPGKYIYYQFPATIVSGGDTYDLSTPIGIQVFQLPSNSNTNDFTGTYILQGGSGGLTITAPECAQGGEFTITYTPPSGSDITDTKTTPWSFDVKKGTSYSITAIEDPVNGNTYNGDLTVTGTTPNTNDFTETVTLAYSDDTAPTWTTAAGNLDRTVECSDATALAAAQTLVPVATDNCTGTLTPVKTPGLFVAGSCPQAGTYTNTWLVTDATGNTSASFTQVINVSDNTAPVISTEAGSLDADLECSDADGIAAAIAAAPEADDNCSNVTIHVVSDETVAGSCVSNYTRTRVWNFTDECNNTSASFTQVINVSDNTAPVISTEAGSLDADLECSDADGIAAAIAAAPEADDNCSNVTIHVVSDETVAGSCVSNYTRTRVWNFTDECNNTSASFTQVINVSDNTAPVISTEAGSLDADLECSDADGIAAAIAAAPEADDNCSNVTIHVVSDETVAGSCVSNYTRTRVWNFTDECNNTSASFTQVINVSDNTAPVISTEAGSLDADLECSDADGIAAAIAAAPEADDNCSNVTIHVVSDETVAGSCVSNYTRTRVWNFTDECNNTSASFTQVINVSDNTAPVISTEAGSLDADLECSDADGIAAAIAAAPEADDNCSNVTIHVVSDETVAGSCVSNYTRTRVWNFTDECNNTSASFTQVINVSDNTAPVISTEAGSLDADLECSDADGIAAAIAAAPEADDNCSNVTIHVVSDETVAGSCVSNYTRTRVWNFTDECNNTSASFTQVINVSDNTAPTVITQNITINLGSDGTASIDDNAVDYGSYDNCSSELIFNLSQTKFSCSDIESETGEQDVEVTLTVTDACGNSASGTAVVTVINDLPSLGTIDGPDDPIALKAYFTVSASFSDNNFFGATWYFSPDGSFADNDSTIKVIGSIQGNTISNTLTLPTGVYTVKLVIQDICGETATEYHRYVVVYDPNGGFVTGGGWIWSLQEHPLQYLLVR